MTSSDRVVAVGGSVRVLWALATIAVSVLLVVVGTVQERATYVALGAGVLGVPSVVIMVRNGRKP